MISATEVSGAGPSNVSSSPIRGRDEQLQMIAGCWSAYGPGWAGVAIIEAAAGLGKTRLLAAARATARTRCASTTCSGQTQDVASPCAC